MTLIVRFIAFLFLRLIYHVRVVGRENLPLTGPALLVPNHVSMIDPLFISAGTKRIVSYFIYRGYYDKWWIRPFVASMGAIPISEADNPKGILRSLLQARERLEKGEMVGIFAEGQISRLGGATLGFKRGLDIVLKGLDVPVIPVHLEGVWGSIFSFAGNKVIWKVPKKIPYPITVTFGAPLRNAAPSAIRQAVTELGAEAFRIHFHKDPTLFDAFLRQAKDFPKHKILADSSGKEVTYRELLTSAVLLGRRLRGEKTVGILLPPSVAGAAVNVALTGNGQVPVNLNYTLPLETVNSICKRAGINKIITSEKMLEKLDWPKDDRMVFLESLAAAIPKNEKTDVYLKMKFLPVAILRRLFFSNASLNPADTAAILFTSGSSGDPKGVVLTQKNLTSNIRSIHTVLQLPNTDKLMGVLPFFHSFGLTASLWYPLLAGFKAVFHTNPLDCKTIAELCRAHQVTFVMGTPTFLSAYLRRIDKSDFASLRFAVAGAEKLRPELAKAFEEKYGVPVLEGYGCTELSPVAALNVPDITDGSVTQTGRKIGTVGRPLPGVSIKIVDPETFLPLEEGKSGLLLVKGANVMQEYLNDPVRTAEVMRDGWYITGDIATIDEDGFIQITDRLSRFSKIGGEMVPHILIEDKLHALVNAVDRMFVVAGIPDETKGEALVVLVAGYTGDLDQLWKDLKATDLPKLWLPDRDKFFTVDAIPLLGSGKIDMHKVKEIIRKVS